MGGRLEQAEGKVGVEDCIMSGSSAFNHGPSGVQLSQEPTEKFERLKDLLRAMFSSTAGISSSSFTGS